jgi:hypothetical protein
MVFNEYNSMYMYMHLHLRWCQFSNPKPYDNPNIVSNGALVFEWQS